MSINKNNVAPFITYLFKKRRGAEPPQQLLDGWSALNNEEIATQLSGLFQSWGLTDEDKRMEVNAFLKESLFGNAKPETVSNHVVLPPIDTQTKVNNNPPKPRKNIWLRGGMVLAIILAIYVGYQFLAYKNLDWIYTITDNVSVRNEQKEVVARMDLFALENGTPSYQKLIAADKEIYNRSIDNSDKLYPCRKVYLTDFGFWDFLIGKNVAYGYVNNNYIVDNEKEYKLYQTVFKEVKNNKAENTALKAVYRKVIIGSMSLEASLENLYIALHEGNLPKAAINSTYGIVKQTLKNNAQYVIIAGLSDGNFYRFEGDIQSNHFSNPVQVLQKDMEGNEKVLTGAFRFANTGDDIALFDCLTKSITNLVAIKDGDGKFARFEYKAPTILEQIFGTDSTHLQNTDDTTEEGN